MQPFRPLLAQKVFMLFRLAPKNILPAAALLGLSAGACVTRTVYVIDDQDRAAPAAVARAQPAPVPSAVVESSGSGARVAYENDVGIVDDSDFYEPLSAYGSWVAYPGYGRVWRPSRTVVGSNFRPYTHGHWENTEWGWTWVDHHPFGWATGHYGRWLYDSNYGWVWTPGTVWSPAWVSWRTGGGYVGWSAMPPGSVYGGSYAVYDTSWVFVSNGQFGSAYVGGVIVTGSAYRSCYVNSNDSRTTVIVYGRSTYRGPDYDEVNRAGRVIHRPLAETERERPVSRPPTGTVIARGRDRDRDPTSDSRDRDDSNGRGRDRDNDDSSGRDDGNNSGRGRDRDNDNDNDNDNSSGRDDNNSSGRDDDNSSGRGRDRDHSRDDDTTSGRDDAGRGRAPNNTSKPDVDDRRGPTTARDRGIEAAAEQDGNDNDPGEQPAPTGNRRDLVDDRSRPTRVRDRGVERAVEPSDERSGERSDEGSDDSGGVDGKDDAARPLNPISERDDHDVRVLPPPAAETTPPPRGGVRLPDEKRPTKTYIDDPALFPRRGARAPRVEPSIVEKAPAGVRPPRERTPPRPNAAVVDARPAEAGSDPVVTPSKKKKTAATPAPTAKAKKR